MRDPELMITLLRKIADTPNGRVIVRNLRFEIELDFGVVLHQLELLIDAGHATRASPYEARITNDGYDFLNAIDADPKYWEKFLEYFNSGMQYAEAAMHVVEFVKTAGVNLNG